MTSTLAYTTATTGEKLDYRRPTAKCWSCQTPSWEEQDELCSTCLERLRAIPEPYCYHCGRCTDHVGEHEALEAAGLVKYEDGGIVARTELWERELATAICKKEYEDYCAHLEARALELGL